MVQYTGWKDRVAPENPSELAHVLQLLYEKIGTPERKQPVVVHCADGMGRSAAFVGTHSKFHIIKLFNRIVGVEVWSSIIDVNPNPDTMDLLKVNLFKPYIPT